MSRGWPFTDFFLKVVRIRLVQTGTKLGIFELLKGETVPKGRRSYANIKSMGLINFVITVILIWNYSLSRWAKALHKSRPSILVYRDHLLLFIVLHPRRNNYRNYFISERANIRLFQAISSGFLAPFPLSLCMSASRNVRTKTFHSLR